MSDDVYLSPAKVAKMLDLSENTLAKLRGAGSGPPYFRVCRRVRYRHADLLIWLDARRRTSTAAMPET